MQPSDEVQHLPFIVALSTVAVTASGGSWRLSMRYSYRVLGHDQKNGLHNSTISENFILYSYNKIQQDALFLKLILIKNTTCFGQIYWPSSGVSTLYTQH